MGVVMKRVVQLGANSGLKTNINVGFAAVSSSLVSKQSPYDHRRHLSHIVNPNEIVDRLAMVSSLEAKGVPSEKAEAITSAITKVSDTYVSHVDMEKDRHFMEIERENSKLRDYLQKMNNDLTQKINHDIHGLKVQLQGQRVNMKAQLDVVKVQLEGLKDGMETKFEAVKVQLEGQKDDLNASLEGQKYDTEAQLEAAKHDVIKYCMGTFHYVLSTPMPEEVQDETLEQTRKRGKWLNDDYVCRGHILNGMCDSLFDIYQNVESAKELWELLEAKYMAEDSSSKKFLVSDFMNYKMVDGRPVMEQYNECLRILGQFEQHGLKMDEAISVPSIIDKLPPSWKDFKHTLKHKKEELNLVQLGSCFRIEESLRVMENVSVKDKGKDIGGSSVNMVEESGPTFKNSNKGNNKRKFQSGYNNKNKAVKRAKQTNDQGCWKCGKPGHFKRDCRSGKAKNEAGTSGSTKDPKQQG